jgi:Na+/H+ antiporter NhaD/arsenite permease-like protein
MDASPAFPGLMVAGVPVEFGIFALTLLGVALFHRRTLTVALCGLGTLVAYKLAFSAFGHAHQPGVGGLVHHLGAEWVTLANLLGLLTGFALLASAFERSQAPAMLPRFLPDGWKGGFVLLLLVFVLSSFLDNIAAAMIGGTIAAVVYQNRVHIGYLAAIVAASNAGGAGSVVGDTTTTMMWIRGASPLDVLHAYVGSAAAFLAFSIIAARQQQAHQPIRKDAPVGMHLDWAQLGIVGLILAFAIGMNVLLNTVLASAWRADIGDLFPWIGAAVWLAIVLSVPLRKPDWTLLPGAVKGSIFLLSLVLCASMMPVEKLPVPSWQTACGLGFVSAVFDNIPLTALAIAQDHYDWGMLAYAVGFGGSMVWFGSSAGVALSNTFPEAKSVGAWLRHGWHVTLAYIVGCAALVLLMGWHPQPLRPSTPQPASVSHPAP